MEGGRGWPLGYVLATAAARMILARTVIVVVHHVDDGLARGHGSTKRSRGAAAIARTGHLKTVRAQRNWPGTGHHLPTYERSSEIR